MLNEKPPKITGTNFNTRKCVRFFPLSSLFTKREKNIKIVKVRTDWVTGILWLGYWKLLRVCVLSFFFTFLVRFPFLFPLNYFAAKKSLRIFSSLFKSIIDILALPYKCSIVKHTHTETVPHQITYTRLKIKFKTQQPWQFVENSQFNRLIKNKTI